MLGGDLLTSARDSSVAEGEAGVVGSLVRGAESASTAPSVADGHAADSARAAFVNALLRAPTAFEASAFTSAAAERHVNAVVRELQLAAGLFVSAADEAEVARRHTQGALTEAETAIWSVSEELAASREEAAALRSLAESQAKEIAALRGTLASGSPLQQTPAVPGAAHGHSAPQPTASLVDHLVFPPMPSHSKHRQRGHSSMRPPPSASASGRSARGIGVSGHSFKCPHCAGVYTSHSALLSHMRKRHHSDEGYFVGERISGIPSAGPVSVSGQTFAAFADEVRGLRGVVSALVAAAGAEPIEALRGNEGSSSSDPLTAVTAAGTPQRPQQTGELFVEAMRMLRAQQEQLDAIAAHNLHVKTDRDEAMRGRRASLGAANTSSSLCGAHSRFCCKACLAAHHTSATAANLCAACAAERADALVKGPPYRCELSAEAMARIERVAAAVVANPPPGPFGVPRSSDAKMTMTDTPVAGPLPSRLTLPREVTASTASHASRKLFAAAPSHRITAASSAAEASDSSTQRDKERAEVRRAERRAKRNALKPALVAESTPIATQPATSAHGGSLSPPPRQQRPTADDEAALNPPMHAPAVQAVAAEAAPPPLHDTTALPTPSAAANGWEGASAAARTEVATQTPPSQTPTRSKKEVPGPTVDFSARRGAVATLFESRFPSLEEERVGAARDIAAKVASLSTLLQLD